MKILVDAFGGDNAPDEILKGAELAAREYDVEVVFFGDSSKIKQSAERVGISIENFEVCHAPDVISMCDSPMAVADKKKKSSMVAGLEALKNGEGDVFVSAGNSGAMLVGTTLTIKRSKGVKRIAFAPVMPSANKSFMLIDGGANSECTAQMLYQFGIMGSIYMEEVFNIIIPRVALLNIGLEETKGDELRHEAYAFLADSNLNFVGNIEPCDVLLGHADVIVVDGFSGNIMLKSFEGTVSFVLNKIKNILGKNLKTKIGAMFIKKELAMLKKEIDCREYGGAPLIGAQKPVFKVHGNSDAFAFKNAIRLAVRYAEIKPVEFDVH